MIRKPLPLLCALALAGSSWASSGNLVICDDIANPLTLNPLKTFSEKNDTICHQIFDGLLRFNPDGRIEPALAVSWKRIDPLKVEFKLRKGVKFHDGEPFNAASVKFTIDRYLDPKTGFPALPFISSIDHAEVVDDATVVLVTKFPDGLLLNRLAGFVVMLPPGYIRKVGEAEFAAHPVGTGAFRFVSWEAGKSITLERNPYYWMHGYPKADGLTFRFIPTERQLDELFSGRVDILTELPGTATMAVARNPGTMVVKKESFYTLAANFNLARGPLKDRRVRQALNYATDREQLIRYDLLGNGRPLATFSMRGEEGFNPDLRPYPYDLAKASKLLKDAGYGSGFKLKAFVKSTGERAARILKVQWMKIGVNLDYEVKNEGDFISQIKSSDLDLAFGGSPDPMAHVFFIQSISLFSQSPFSIISSPEYDRQLLEMASTLDDDKRVLLAKKLDQYIYEEALGVFTYQKTKTYGVRRGVSFVPSVSGMPALYSTVPAARRKQ